MRVPHYVTVEELQIDKAESQNVLEFVMLLLFLIFIDVIINPSKLVKLITNLLKTNLFCL